MPAEASNGALSEERKSADLRYLKEVLDDEQQRRDAIAREHGWSTHPNDMELTDTERRVVLLAWQFGAPQPYPDKASE